ncbi:Cytidine deaminase [Tripterygium wilfordii]|uniref:cytidine deaminase n=1 Tax=Tripterygium wilfordii TaxID=458696 RepID=A0A7J7DQ59_TRIWF|nr:cytidine deaminase 1 [Tripterygium wilfordii]KAF5748490.1 Cytidine deaminase [Tripterygium wilfordii]
MDRPRFVIDAAEAESMAKQLGLTVPHLLPSLVKSAQALARPPISNFSVGAVGLGSSGRIYLGANLEFPGLPLHHSVHAEQFLVTNLFLNAEPHLRYIAVSDAPCGHCRQFLQETRGASNIEVLITGQDEPNYIPVSQLLPHRFGPDDLLTKDVPLLLESHRNGLGFPNNFHCNGETGNWDLLKHAALEAANKSHAPYSRCPSGVALMDSEGKIYRGSYMESAAYNPSLGPVQAAVVALLMGGGEYEGIVAAVLVEKEGAVVKQEQTARLLLQSISTECEFKVFHCSLNMDGFRE